MSGEKNALSLVRASPTHTLVIKFLLGTLICSVETIIGVCLALESSPVGFFFSFTEKLFSILSRK